MSIYVIGDLHLAFSQNKPMDIFGKQWENHTEKLQENWNKVVKKDDLVVLAGDFSWATYLEDTKKDFEFLTSLPGKKLMLKGNHDYWWTTITNMKKFLEENNFKNIEFLHNNSYIYENKIIVGTRGWALLDSENSEKMLNREAQRLELSIKDGLEKNREIDKNTETKISNETEKNKELEKEQNNNEKEIICIMHYPPIIDNDLNQIYKNEYVKIMKKYNIKECYYAHLHGLAHKNAIEGNYEGIEFKLVSGDYLDFNLLKVN